MDAMEESRQRAIRITKYVMRRVDLGILADIRDFDCPKKYYESDLKTLGIHADAWKHVIKQKIEPKFVFAHPCILSKLPKSSLHYRGISTLSLKRVSSITVSVKKWENGTNKQTPDHLTCVRVACLYNAIISTIITNSDNWSIENGYRNILATIGITEDGKLRNIIGIEGENYVKQSILNWLKTEKQIPFEIVKKDTHYLLGDEKNIRMVFSSEPDILFEKKQVILGILLQPLR